MTKTVQLLAIAGTEAQETKARMAQLKNVAGQSGQFEGYARTYERRFEDGAELPAESKSVNVTTDELLALTRQVLTRHFDLALTLDHANAVAKADVTLDGLMLKDVPVGHLQWLDKEVSQLRELVAALPERERNRTWDSDGVPAGQARGRSWGRELREKTPFRFPRGNGTEHFQEQVDIMFKDDVIGTWTQVDYTGKIAPERKEQLLARLRELSEALRMAREGANTAVVTDRSEGALIFDWLTR